MTTAPELTPREQLDAAVDRRCWSHCGGTALLRPMRLLHLYASPVPQPTRDYPCTVCGRLRVDWTHWYRPPAGTTHILQCQRCLAILGSVTLLGGDGS
jgi:hypothetical protein